MASPAIGKPTESSPSAFARHWPVFVSIALAILAVILFSMLPWDPKKLPWSAINLTVSVSDLAGKLAPLAVAAAVIERAVEILISPWRDGEANKLSRVVDAARAAVAKSPADGGAAAKLKEASDTLDDYKSQTQQYAFAISLALSVLASMAGVRAGSLLRCDIKDPSGRVPDVAAVLFLHYRGHGPLGCPSLGWSGRHSLGYERDHHVLRFDGHQGAELREGAELGEFLIRAQLYTQHLGHGREVQAPIGLISIPDAEGVERAVLVGAFFHTKELALLAGRVGKAKVHAAVNAGNQKFIVAELRNERAANRVRVARWVIARPELRKSIFHRGPPLSE